MIGLFYSTFVKNHKNQANKFTFDILVTKSCSSQLLYNLTRKTCFCLTDKFVIGIEQLFNSDFRRDVAGSHVTRT